MKKNFELLGFPGSGKSLVLDRVQKNSQIYQSYENVLFTDMLKRGFISYFYYLYIKITLKNDFSNYLKTKVSLENNGYLKKKIFIKLNEELNKQFKLFSKKHPKIIKNFKSLINFTNTSDFRKKKILKNFKTYCSAYNYYLNKYKNSDIVFVNDEGFYQRVFLNYVVSDEKKIYLNINKYLKTLPKDIVVLNLTTSITKSINQCKRRGKYFSYENNLNFFRRIFPKINKSVIKFCINNKIKYYKINPIKKNIKLKLK